MFVSVILFSSAEDFISNTVTERRCVGGAVVVVGPDNWAVWGLSPSLAETGGGTSLVEAGSISLSGLVITGDDSSGCGVELETPLNSTPSMVGANLGGGGDDSSRRGVGEAMLCNPASIAGANVGGFGDESSCVTLCLPGDEHTILVSS